MPEQTNDILWDFDSIEDIRNSAGDRFNPPVTYEMPMERVEIVFHPSLLWHDTGARQPGPVNALRRQLGQLPQALE